MTKKAPSAPRCAALVGPYVSGKTTLLEAILSLTGATQRRGSVRDGNTVGDGSPEARARQMSTELSVATTTYLGDTWTFIDCPGSIELLQDSYHALMVAAAEAIASVVTEDELNPHYIVPSVFNSEVHHAVAAAVREAAQAGATRTAIRRSD